MADDTALPRRLSGADALMWRIEADPVLRSPILVMALLDREPDAEDVRAALAWWQAQFPRLRQRLTVSSRLPGGARWVDCDEPSLDFHVRRVRVPEPADIGAVLAVAEPTVAASFDPARPLWELTIVDGVADGRAALLLRFHHTLTDGVGGVELAGQLFDRSRRPRRRAGGHQPAPVAMPALPSSLAAVARLAAGTARLGADAIRHPVTAAGGARRLAGSLARALAPGRPGSPVFHDRGLDRHLDVLEIPLDRLQRAAHAAGCTLNDVFLAAVGGAIRAYHERLGHPVSVLQCTMPISLRSERDPQGGNRFAPARFALPIDDPDPVARARIAGDIARRWRSEPALGWTGLVAAVLDLAPDPVVTRLVGATLKNVDVDAVNVPGLRHTAYFAGARVDRLWAFAPPTGAALSVTLLTHIDTCCVALMCDRQAVPDHELLRTCLDSALDEVSRLGVDGMPIERPA